MNLYLGLLIAMTALMCTGLTLFWDLKRELGNNVREIRKNTACLGPLSEQVGTVRSLIGAADFLAEHVVSEHFYEQQVQGKIEWPFLDKWFESRSAGLTKRDSRVGITNEGRSLLAGSSVGRFIDRERRSLTSQLESSLSHDASDTDVIGKAFAILRDALKNEEIKPEKDSDIIFYLGSINLRDIFQKQHQARDTASSPEQE